MAALATPTEAVEPAALVADIPAQPLREALTTFARQTGLQVFYLSGVVGKQSSRRVPAGVPAGDGLARLLEGTGLRFEYLTPRSIRILAAKDSFAEPPHLNADAAAALPEEVVVTATKREEPLAAVPMSVTVFSQRDMEAQNITGIEEIAVRTPGVEYGFSTQYGAGILTNIAIRGVGGGNGQSTTGLYIDDAPIHVRHTPFANPYPLVFDLQRVEVLRGPQGTLFGVGTEGGAIRYITHEPNMTDAEGHYRAQVSATDGGGLSYEAGAAAGAPLIDGYLAGRISAWYRDDGGYVDRVNPFDDTTVDDDANRRKSSLLRAALAFSPSETLRITPSLTYQSIRVHDSPSFYVYLSDPGDSVLDNGKLLRQPASDSFSLASVKVEANFARATLTSASSYFNRSARATVDETNGAGIAYYGGFGNPLGPAYPSSYADAVATQLQAHQIVLSQEVRLASSETQSRFAWLAGLFFLHADQDATHLTYAVTDPQQIGIHSDDRSLDTEAAAFGRVTLALSQHWHASAGLRVGWVKSDSTELEGGFANSDTIPWLRITDREVSAPTPRFDLTYNIDSGNLLYATVAKGFRTGGHNVPQPAQCGAAASYGPDSVWSRELGTKDALFDRRLQLATSVFYVSWTGIQENLLDSCGNGYTVNAGSATSAGVDFTADALLTEHLRMGLALELLDAHYTNTVMTGDGVVVERGTVIGSLPSEPSPWSGTTWLEYRTPLARDLVVYARAEDIIHSHNPGPFTESDPRSNSYDPTLIADPATNLLNLYLGLVRSGLEIKLSVNNALNSQPILQRASDSPGSTLYYAYTFQPRTVALTLSQQF